MCLPEGKKNPLTHLVGTGNTIEIDLDGITCADHTGEQALLALWRDHRRFVCTSVFARALCEGLGIPVEEGAR